jgi:hypothetical protein
LNGSGNVRLTNHQYAAALAASSQHLPQQQQPQQPSKPVTVRCVKRRDKAKMEEKRMMSQLENSILASRINRFNQGEEDDEDEEEAVMV